ncbi:MAG TPA: cyclic nucleotide-binding domain-containing protein [Acidimicrobiia bacterium]|nr:cyclic nucleotide-binding domain-containing protein [Acidimicrobiia bacterium]
MSEEILSLLESSPFLGALSKNDAERLASIASIREFSPGEAIVREGSTEAMTMWIIVDGEVEVRRGATVVTTMGRGSHIGEMALFADSGHPRSAGVYAISDVRAFRVAKWDLMPFVERNPKVATAIIQELARRLERVTNQLTD